MVSIALRGRRFKNAASIPVVAGLLLTGADAVFAEPLAEPAAAAGTPSGGSASAAACNVKRPVVLFNRWQEDWSVLANPCNASRSTR